jgi:N utilization substance protein B
VSVGRHQAREIAFQILYRHDQVRAQQATGDAPVTLADATTDLSRELGEHFEHFQVAPELREFAALLAAGTIRHTSELDALLEKHAANWRISRMSLVDRNLLRMAIYELKHVPETPPSVVLDEAIELAKQFGTSESPAFINGVLDAIKTDIRGAS